MNVDEIIDRLRELRAERNLSQRAFALRLGYSHTTLSGWESQRRMPDLRALCDWCEALDLEIGFEKRTGAVRARYSGEGNGDLR